MSRRFYGSHHHKLDPKGRLTLPSEYRDPLVDGAVVAPWEQCLAIFPSDDFDAITIELEQQVRRAGTSVDALRLFQHSAHHADLDAQGRVLIRNELRSYAKLDEEVVVAGSGARIEVWNPEILTSTHDEGAPDLSALIRKGLSLQMPLEKPSE